MDVPHVLLEKHADFLFQKEILEFLREYKHGGRYGSSLLPCLASFYEVLSLA